MKTTVWKSRRSGETTVQLSVRYITPRKYQIKPSIWWTKQLAKSPALDTVVKTHRFKKLEAEVAELAVKDDAIREQKIWKKQLVYAKKKREQAKRDKLSLRQKVEVEAKRGICCGDYGWRYRRSGIAMDWNSIKTNGEKRKRTSRSSWKKLHQRVIGQKRSCLSGCSFDSPCS